MGRDLSNVRVHSGPEATEFSASIGARAFTYTNHIWLGSGEAEGATFTMAHELAHVLQQTQPPDIATAPASSTTRSGPAVQRSTYWLPKGASKRSILAARGRYHDEAANAIGATNPSVILEAPMPGANRKGAHWKKFGFADLYMSDNGNSKTVGVTHRSPNTTAAAGIPLVDFTLRSPSRQGSRFVNYKKQTKGGVAYDHEGERQPRLSTKRAGSPRTLINLDQAPKNIRIGDVKPGHNEGEQAKGVSQISAYIAGINSVKDVVNGLPASQISQSGGATQWNPNTSRMRKGDITIPANYDPANVKPNTGSELELHTKGKVFTPAKRVRGRMVVVWIQGRRGLWGYVWVPTTSFKSAANPSELQPAAVQLQKLLARLKATPGGARVRTRPISGVSARCRRSGRRRFARIRPTHGRRIVQLRKSDKAIADGFDAKTWEKTRGRLKTTFNKVPDGKLDEARFQLAAIEASKDYRDKFQSSKGPVKIAAPKDPANPDKSPRLLRKLDFWLSVRGKAMGIMRKIFGKAFVVGHNAFLKLSRLFQKNKKIAPAKTASSLPKAALSALLRVLMIVGGAVVKRTGQVIAGAVISCFSRRMSSLFGGTLENLEANIKQIEVGGKTIEQLAAMSEAELATYFFGARVGKLITDLDDHSLGQWLFGPYDKHLSKLKTAIDALSTATTVIDVIRWAIRIVACLSPPALGCLWLVAEAALSWAFARFIQSCWFLKKITPHLLRLPAVRNIAGALASTVLGSIDKVLPTSVLGGCSLEAALSDAKQQAPSSSDVDRACDRSGRQPTEAELKLAEMLEAVPAAKLVLLEEWAQRQGWGAGTDIDLKTADKLVEYLKTTSIDEIRKDLKKKTGAPPAVSKFEKVADEKGKDPASKQSVAESSRRKSKTKNATKSKSTPGDGTEKNSGSARAGSPSPVDLKNITIDKADKGEAFTEQSFSIRIVAVGGVTLKKKPSKGKLDKVSLTVHMGGFTYPNSPLISIAVIGEGESKLGDDEVMFELLNPKPLVLRGDLPGGGYRKAQLDGEGSYIAKWK